MISELNISEIREHYNLRKEMHVFLRKEFLADNVDSYVRNAIGIDGERGNYSASEHRLGPSILGDSTTNNVFRLAQELYQCTKESHIPDIIYRRSIPYLKISVGSEMAMMLRPEGFWVGNVRTIWAHLLLKHDWNRRLANEELNLYRDSDRSSEMDYRIWRDIYLSLKPSLLRICELGNEEAERKSIVPGELKFLWADAIASNLYNLKE